MTTILSKINYTNKHNQQLKGYKFQFRSNYGFLKDFEGNRLYAGCRRR